MNINGKNKKVIFFVGAGASKEFGIPLLNEITEKLIKEMELNQDELFSRLFKNLVKVVAQESMDLEEIFRFLNILINLEMKDFDKIMQILSFSSPDLRSKINEKGGDVLKVLKANHSRIHSVYKYVMEKVKEIFVRECSRGGRQSSDYWEVFLKKIEEILNERIRPYIFFTVNYDLVIERFCEDKGIKCITGFGEKIKGYINEINPLQSIGYWFPELFKRNWGDNFLILHKLHGSLNWEEVDGNITSKPQIGGIDIRTGREYENIILYPAGYQHWTKEPFIELLYQFRNHLKEAKYLIVIGYSFRDPVIQEVLLQGFKKNKELEMILIDPRAEELIQNRLKEIKSRVKPCPYEFGKEKILENLVSSVRKIINPRKILYFEPLGTNFDNKAKIEKWSVVRTEEILQKQIKNCDILILFLHQDIGKGLNDDLQRDIVNFVEKGGKLIALHDVLYPSRNQILAEELCGCFSEHLGINEVEVDIKKRHFIIEGVERFKIRDEKWRRITPKKTSDEELQVLFSTPTGQPLGWLRNYGKGEIFVFALGHHKEIIENKNIQKIIFNAVKYFSRRRG